VERWGDPRPADGAVGTLYQGDNLEILSGLAQRLAGTVDLIYIDPPFATGDLFYGGREAGASARRQGRGPAAFSDRWAGGMAGYLGMMAPRLLLMRELLSETGSLMVHVDHRARAHLRLLLDEVFGADALVNEIAWCYGGGGAPRKRYPRKHDMILWYARGDAWTFNRQFRPYSAGTLQRGLTRVKGDRYRLRPEGAGLDDWWHGPEVGKILSPTARENLKYPTQKPEGLLERVIQGHSNPGDLVADFFCGSGTTLAVAARLGRRWLGCDAGARAIQTCRKRLARLDPPAGFEVHAPRELSPGAGPLRVERDPEGPATLTLRWPADAPPLDYWAVDFDHDGALFRPGWISVASRKVPAETVAVGSGLRALALVVDVEGGEAWLEA